MSFTICCGRRTFIFYNVHIWPVNQVGTVAGKKNVMLFFPLRIGREPNPLTKLEFSLLRDQELAGRGTRTSLSTSQLTDNTHMYVCGRRKEG